MTLAPLVLPKELTGVAEKLTRAVREVAVLAEWPEEKPAFLAAPQPEAIAKALLPVLHQHLEVPRAASIAYLFREEMQKRGRVRLGVAGKGQREARIPSPASTSRSSSTGPTWTKLSPPQRIALVDHELSHCGLTDKGAWTMVSHDVEEFASIVKRWGLWTPDLVNFNTAIKSMQTDLFQAAD